MRNPKMLTVFIVTLFVSAGAFAERGDSGNVHSSGGGGGHSSGGGGGRAGGWSSNGGNRSFGNRNFNGWGRANNYYQRPGGYYRNGNGRVYQNPNGGWNRNGNSSYSGNAYSPRGSFVRSNNVRPVSSAMRKMGVRSLPSSVNSGRVLTGAPHNAKIAAPRTGPGGAPFHGLVMGRTQMNSKVVRGQMGNIARSGVFARQANMLNATENRTGHYYWHNWNGTNYCHYNDGYGCNWYGWNCGGGLFWSCWYGGNWWWYDPFYSRWDYWYDNCWWWQNPTNVNIVYAYDGNGYVSSADGSAPSQYQNQNAPQGNQQSYNGNPAPSQYQTEASGDIQTVDSNDYKSPDEQEAVQPQAQSKPAGGVYDSPDGKNEVRVTDSGDAFLYDMGKTGPKPVYLDSNVKEVNFSKPVKGKAGQIMVILNDGSFETFDMKGKPVS